MELDWTTATVGSVTLVRVRLRNERAVARTVRLRNLLDGPVLPPRRQRVPEAGWDRDGVTATVPAERTVARGYACPAPSAEPPVEVAAVGSPEEITGAEKTGADVIRDLGDARPPRAVLGGKQGTSEAETGAVTTRNPCERDHEDEEPAVADSRNADPGRTGQRELPPPVDDVLLPYRRRVEAVEAFGVASVAEATELLNATGGLAGVERAGEQLGTDAGELRALAAEAAALAARAEAATPPLDALRRLS